MKDCHICLGVHDSAIHEATASVRAWFREQVLMDRTLPPPKKPNPGIAEVRKLRNPIGDFPPRSTPGPGWNDFAR